MYFNEEFTLYRPIINMYHSSKDVKQSQVAVVFTNGSLAPVAACTKTNGDANGRLNSLTKIWFNEQDRQNLQCLKKHQN